MTSGHNITPSTEPSHEEIMRKVASKPQTKKSSDNAGTGNYSIKPACEPSHEEILRKTK